MSSDLLAGPDDEIDTEPAELRAAYLEAVEIALAKRLASDQGIPWTQELESSLQEKIAALVGAARELGIATFYVVAVKPDGRRVKSEMNVNVLSRTRNLQS